MTAPPTQGAGAVRTVLAVLLLLLPVVAGVGVWRWQDQEYAAAMEARREDGAAVKAATREVLAWASVDYRAIDEYFSSVEAGATGTFLEQFKASEPALRTLLEQNKSVQVPTIPKDGAGLLERDGDTARVLVALDATVSNTSTKKPQPRQYRLQLTVHKVAGEWRTENLEFIG